MIIVGNQTNADCSTIQEALTLCEANGVREIYIQEGIYDERVEIRLHGLSICGAGPEKTRITGALYGFMPYPDIGKLGTFRSYTMLIDANDVTLRDLTIENRAGAGPSIGQAIALYADGDHLHFENLRLLGWQDTLFTGPLPEKEIEVNGFIGPKQYAPRIPGHHVYKNCYIEGDVDFIFGSASAYFDHCTIFQKDRDKTMETFGTTNVENHTERPVKGYATAPSTPEGTALGYVFEDCRFESDCPKESCYLGRPWRNFAKVAVCHSYLGSQISHEGFHNWNKKDAEATVSFVEYGNYGPGASTEKRASFVTELTTPEYDALQLLVNKTFS